MLRGKIQKIKQFSSSYENKRYFCIIQALLSIETIYLVCKISKSIWSYFKNMWVSKIYNILCLIIIHSPMLSFAGLGTRRSSSYTIFCSELFTSIPYTLIWLCRRAIRLVFHGYLEIFYKIMHRYLN